MNDIPNPADGPPTLRPGLESHRTESGLEYLDVHAGEGAAAGEGREVAVHYHAWTVDGTLVERTDRSGPPLRFVPGEGRVIAALEEGVIGMRAGGRRRLITPSDLAYGPRGEGRRIPPYATLIVDVELVSVGDE